MDVIKLLPKQREFVESPETEILYSGSYGGGKSVALCAKVVFLSLRYTRNRIYLCRKVLEDLKKTTLKTLLEGDGTVPAILSPELIVSHNKHDRIIRLINGSEIFYGPVDVQRMKSMNLGAVAIDECTELSEEEYNACLGRLRLAGVPIRQIFSATNPSSEQHWLYNRFKVNPPLDKHGNKKTKMIATKTEDNHHLPEEYLENLKRTHFGHYYRRYVLGEWCGSEDLVYDNFDLKIHIIPNFVPPKSWKRYRSVDFGYRSPFVCCWFVVCGKDVGDYNDKLKEGDLILYKEIYYTERTTQVNAQRILYFSKHDDGENERIVFTVSDWSAGERADLEAAGIKTLKADKDITSGIQSVRERLGNADPTRGLLVRPRFYIFENTILEHDPKIRLDMKTGEKNNNPTCAKEEFLTYGWKPNKNKEEPDDKFNHAMDTIRYFMKAYDNNKRWRDIEFLSL